MKRVVVFISLLVVICSIPACTTAAPETADMLEGGVWKQSGTFNGQEHHSYMKVYGNQYDTYGSIIGEANVLAHTRRVWPDDFLGVSAASCKREATDVSITYTWTFVESDAPPVMFTYSSSGKADTKAGSTIEYESSGEVVITKGGISKKVSWRGRTAGSSEWTIYTSEESEYSGSTESDLAAFTSGKTIREVEDWNPNGFSLDREKIIGTWQVVQAKYTEDAKMTAWEYEDTYATFKENGRYEGKGYFGDGEGVWTVSGNIITVLIDNQPYITYTVTGQTDDVVELTATLMSSGTKIWMVCSRSEELNIEPGTDITYDDYFNSESAVIMVLDGVYGGLASFIVNKNAIESELLSGNFNNLTPFSQNILDLWTAGYAALARANLIIEKVDSELYPQHIAHAKNLRAFIGYQLATLWGNVPFYTSTQSVGDSSLAPMSRDEILTIASEDIGSVWDVEYTIGGYDGHSGIYLTEKGAQILYSEIQLAIKNIPELSYLLNDEFQRNALFSIYQQGAEPIPVYTSNYCSLLVKESAHKEDVLNNWKNSGQIYGYWQALVRMGKAQEVTGCKDYQTLFPIPQRELESNNKLSQNPGY